MIKELITYKDFLKIVSQAKLNMFNLNLPLHISKKQLEPRDIASVATLDAILMHLNGRNLLTNPVSIDYTTLVSYECDISDLEEK